MINNTCNILIVEDEWISAEFISDFLLSLGHNVIGVASSASEALLITDDLDLDLVFMDINIDGPMDGIALAKKLNEKKETPVVFITAFGDSQTIQEASETNIYGFVIKPFEQSDIEAVLNVAMARVKREKKKNKDFIHLEPTTLDLGYNYIYNFGRQTLYYENKIVGLSKNESKLLFLFCSNYGDIVSLFVIRSCGWNEKDVTASTIRDTILRLRKKIKPLLLENIVGMGYSLKEESQN